MANNNQDKQMPSKPGADKKGSEKSQGQQGKPQGQQGKSQGQQGKPQGQQGTKPGANAKH